MLPSFYGGFVLGLVVRYFGIPSILRLGYQMGKVEPAECLFGNPNALPCVLKGLGAWLSQRMLGPNNELLRELRDLEGIVLTIILLAAGIWMCAIAAALVADRYSLPPERVLEEQKKKRDAAVPQTMEST